MALTGKDNTEKIYNYLIEKINNVYGVCGLMGNLQAESGMNPHNLQNTSNKKWGITDDEYTRLVDIRNDGKYVLPNGVTQEFANDKAGYGIAQWTYAGRKQKLYNFAKKRKASIGDLETQLDFLYIELTTQYKAVWKYLLNAQTVLSASTMVLTKFERPKNQDDSVKKYRAQLGLDIQKKMEEIKPTFFPNGTELDLTGDVYLRSGDSKETSILGTMKKGSTVVVLGHSERTGWYKVFHKGLNKTGWCTYKYF